MRVGHPTQNGVEPQQLHAESAGVDPGCAQAAHWLPALPCEQTHDRSRRQHTRIQDLPMSLAEGSLSVAVDCRHSDHALQSRGHLLPFAGQVAAVATPWHPTTTVSRCMHCAAHVTICKPKPCGCASSRSQAACAWQGSRHKAKRDAWSWCLLHGSLPFRTDFRLSPACLQVCIPLQCTVVQVCPAASPPLSSKRP